jgi:4-carboxymuconolactone decarboxylase
MKIIHLKDVEAKENAGPLFTAPVTMQSVVTENDSDNNVAYVHFPAGVRNKLHVHSHDQILIVTEGIGTIATEGEENAITVGDIVVIPAGEKHWHGANKDSAMTHITITSPDTTLEQIEK